MDWRHRVTRPDDVWGRGRISRAALVVPLLVLATACNGDDDATPSTSAVVTSPPTADIVENTSPPTAPATTPVASIATTSPPDSTIPPLTPDEQAVVDATVAAWNAWNEVLLEPTNDARVEAIARTHTGEALQRAIDVITRRRVENRKSVTNADLPAYIQPDERSVVVDLENGVAEIEYCHLDSNVAVEIGRNDDGTDRVLDDSIAIRFERETFERVDGQWLKSDGVSVDAVEGETECPG